MAKYVMSDIHGNKDKFFTMLKEIKFSSKDELYIIGDIIDRGDYGFEIYDYIMKQKNIHFMLGNHEIALLNCDRCIKEENWKQLELWKNYWFEGHGEDTYTMFFGEWEKEQREKYIQFLKQCPIDMLVKVNKKYHYMVHAGISNDIFEKVQHRSIMNEIVDRNCDVLIRERENGIYELGVGLLSKEEKDLAKDDGWVINPIVWFGHTPTFYFQDGPIRIWKKQNFRNIDCGCNGQTTKGKLCCVRLSDEQEFYI